MQSSEPPGQGAGAASTLPAPGAAPRKEQGYCDELGLLLWNPAKDHLQSCAQRPEEDLGAPGVRGGRKWLSSAGTQVAAGGTCAAIRTKSPCPQPSNRNKNAPANEDIHNDGSSRFF